jgi:hypothetical protein
MSSLTKKLDYLTVLGRGWVNSAMAVFAGGFSIRVLLAGFNVPGFTSTFTTPVQKKEDFVFFFRTCPSSFEEGNLLFLSFSLCFSFCFQDELITHNSAHS